MTSAVTAQAEVEQLTIQGACLMAELLDFGLPHGFAQAVTLRFEAQMRANRSARQYLVEREREQRIRIHAPESR